MPLLSILAFAMSFHTLLWMGPGPGALMVVRRSGRREVHKDPGASLDHANKLDQRSFCPTVTLLSVTSSTSTSSQSSVDVP